MGEKLVTSPKARPQESTRSNRLWHGKSGRSVPERPLNESPQTRKESGLLTVFVLLTWVAFLANLLVLGSSYAARM